jgi:hypothetical protein
MFVSPVTHKVELARCCRVGDIRVRCCNVGHRQDRVVVVSHHRVYLRSSRREAISRSKVTLVTARLYNGGTSSFMLVKINTQAYEVIVDETLSKFSTPPLAGPTTISLNPHICFSYDE